MDAYNRVDFVWFDVRMILNNLCGTHCEEIMFNTRDQTEIQHQVSRQMNVLTIQHQVNEKCYSSAVVHRQMSVLTV
jgi:hypothetical protein